MLHGLFFCLYPIANPYDCSDYPYDSMNSEWACLCAYQFILKQMKIEVPYPANVKAGM